MKQDQSLIEDDMFLVETRVKVGQRFVPWWAKSDRAVFERILNQFPWERDVALGKCHDTMVNCTHHTCYWVKILRNSFLMPISKSVWEWPNCWCIRKKSLRGWRPILGSRRSTRVPSPRDIWATPHGKRTRIYPWDRRRVFRWFWILGEVSWVVVSSKETNPSPLLESVQWLKKMINISFLQIWFYVFTYPKETSPLHRKGSGDSANYTGQCRTFHPCNPPRWGQRWRFQNPLKNDNSRSGFFDFAHTGTTCNKKEDIFNQSKARRSPKTYELQSS